MPNTHARANLITPTVARVWLQLESDDLTLEVVQIPIDTDPSRYVTLEDLEETEKEEQPEDPEEERWNRFEAEWETWKKLHKKTDFSCRPPRIFGDLPSWLSLELDAIGWNDLMGLGGCHSKHPSGLFLDDSVMTWALEAGIAPYQPFLVEFRCPVYNQDIWGEWDVEYNQELICVEPLSPEEAAKNWDEFLKERQENIDCLVAEKTRHAANRKLAEEQAKTCIDAMFILIEPYQSYGAYRDEAPDRSRYILCSKLQKLPNSPVARQGDRVHQLARSDDERGYQEMLPENAEW